MSDWRGQREEGIPGHNRRRRSVVGVALLVAIAAAITVACGGRGGSTSRPGVTAKSAVSTPAPFTSSSTGPLADQIAWVTLEIGSATYNVHQAVAESVARRERITIQLIPTGTDLGRLAMFRDGRADVGADPGIYAFEGLASYAVREAGPIPVRLIAINWPKTNQLVGCAGDLGIREPKDLRGKRMVFVANSFGFNLNMEATLAAGGLTWADVTRVVIPTYGGAGRAIMEYKADCTWTATNTGFIYEMANSPRGYAPVYMRTPEEDPEMWARFKKVNPVAVPGKATIGAAPISKENPHIGNSPHFASVATLASRDADAVYAMTRAIYEAFPDFNGSYPGVEGFGPDRARFDGIWTPIHEGTIRYFKERNWWTPQAEQRQRELLQRQPVLQAAWEKATHDPHGTSLQGDEWSRFWMKRRVEALKATGLDPLWDEPFWIRLT